MKKYWYLLSVFLLSSCSQESELLNNSTVPTGNDIIECLIGESPELTVIGPTKTTLSSSNVPLWASGDKISVLAEGGSNASFQIVKGEGTAKGTFKGGLPSANQFCAFYPYNSENSWTSGVLHFSQPSVQSSVINGFSGPCSVMVSTFTSAGLNPSFKNVFGLLQLQLAGNAYVSKISLTSNKANEMLWGNFSLTIDGKEGTDLQTLSVTGGNNKVSLQCASPVRLSESESTSFYFAIPAGSLSEGFIINIYDAKDQVIYTKSTSKNQSIVRSSVLRMPLLNDVDIDPATSTVPEPFTWSAYNDLERTVAEATVIDPQTSSYPQKNNDKFVGIFYTIWHGWGNPGTDFNTGPYDIHELNSHSYEFRAAGNGYGGSQVAHHWGKPYLDYYVMDDGWVIRKHAQMLSDAGVDFIAIDVTNNEVYKNRVVTICNTYRAMRDEGSMTPQITFMFAHENEKNFPQLADLYSNSAYSDLWFKLDGKPLLLADRTKMTDYSSSYTFRLSWYIWNGNWQTDADAGDPWWGTTQAEHKAKWPWGVCYTGPGDPMVPGYDSNGNVEFCSVMPATHPISNVGRSFQVGSGNQSKKNNPGTPYTADPAKGIYFKQQFAAAKALNPKILFFTGWNEWVAQRNSEGALQFYYMGGKESSNSSIFVDEYNHEFSRDIEPLDGDFGDNYYYYMADFIRQFKGVDRIPVFNKTRTISIDASFDDWTGVTSCYADDKGDVKSRSYQGWGYRGTLTNSTGRNDLHISKVAKDDSYLYFFIEAMNDISDYYSATGLKLLIKSAGASSWEGFNYIVEPTGTTTATLSSCSGSGALSKTTVDSGIRIAVSGKCMEVAVPMNKLGIANVNSFSIDFKWVDNVDLSQSDGIQRCMRDGDSAPNGRFRYRYVFKK